METLSDVTEIQPNQGHIQVVANISIDAKVARRLVSVQLMKKVGQMIIAGKPEISVDGNRVYWEVPLFVVPPDGDSNTYLLVNVARVDATSGIYIMESDFIETIKAESTPILRRLYPNLSIWRQKPSKLAGGL